MITKKPGTALGVFTLVTALLIMFGISACGQSFSIVGNWKDTDGTVRVFSDEGTCQNVEKVDIGGAAATYTIASSPDSSGYYSLTVQQGGMNLMNWYVKVNSNNSIGIYQQENGSPMYSLIRE